MAKDRNEATKQPVTAEAMQLDVPDEGRGVKDDPRPVETLAKDAPDKTPGKPLTKEESLGANFPLLASDLPIRGRNEKEDQRVTFPRKKPNAQAETTVTQICREDLDEMPRLGKTVLVCPYCKVFMEACGTEPGFTIFNCPVDGCQHTRKMIKPTLRELLMRDVRGQEDHSARP